MSSSHVSRSPIRERGSDDFDFDRVGKSSARQRNVSKSPLRERGAKTLVSVRTRDVTRSPMRGERTYAFSGGVSKSPARSMNGDIPGAEEEAFGRKMTPTTPSNSWLPDDKHMGKSDDDYSGRRRTWRDQVDRVDQISDEHRMACEASVGNLVHGIDPSKEKMHRDMRFRGDYVGGYIKSRETAHQWVTRRDGVGVIHGKSSYNHESVYGYGDPRHSSESLRGPASLLDLELERAELLQKYKELKDQLTNLDDKRLSSPGFYSGSNDYSEDESWRFRRGSGSGQQFVLDKIVRRPFHSNHGPGPVHHTEDEYRFAPLYDDPFSGQRTRASRPNQWHQDFDQEPLESYHDKTRYHHPRIGNDWRRQELPNSLACGTSSNIATNFGSSQSLDLESHGSRAYNPRMAQTSPQERPSYLAHHHPRRVLATNLNKQLCHPISGGAPFVLCNKCFRLLKLPQRFMAVNKKDQHQLQCGACSAVMSCDLQNRYSGLHSSQKKPDSVDAAASGLDELVLKESGMEHHRNGSGATSTNLGSYDFDAVGCSFQSKDSETSEVSKGQRSGISVADSKQHRSPSPSRSSKEDHFSDNASVQSGTRLLPPPPSSPLRDPLAPYSYFGKPEGGEVKQITEKDTCFVSSAENTMDATEAEVHFNEVPTTSLSQDSGDDLREEDKAGNKDRQSSIPAFMKQDFVSIAGHGSHGRAEVYVNGQHIQHRLVKRAEKLAGPIQPGEYWYDSKAGFWGVMGHHCFGIIPPFIQEFSFPMPMNCSAGDTAVYINGRELHKRDLELLTSRGLPTTRNKNFIIDISGKVLDEETKEFVVNLGKLAPTVERNRCGFGMQVPEHLND